MRTNEKNSKERIIIAAIDEIQEHGITDFSVRRVAEKCSISPGAPYKHFSNKNELILQALRYINIRWNAIQEDVIARHPDDTREQLTAISMAYIRFLCDNPAFQSIVMLNDSSMAPEQLKEKALISEISKRLIADYCREVGMDDETAKRKTYIVRSLIYGAALMINSGSLPLNEQTLSMAEQSIAREFNLP